MSYFINRLIPAAALAAITLSLLNARESRAEVVFSNFPDSGAATEGSVFGPDRLKDIRFSVGAAAYTLDSVEAFLTGNGGSATLSLFSDNGAGVPGSLLTTIATQTVSGAGVVAFVPGSTFTLAAGTTYHLVMGGGADITWNQNLNNTPASARNGSGFSNYGTTFSFDNGATWPVSNVNSQVQINASAVVPEAGTLALALPALGMVGAVVIKRRKK